jgi:hypothetical protein
MLPNFLIIGAAKAASTWLSDSLGEHPDVFIAKIKEVRFFSRYYDKGVEWYETHFQEWSGQKAVGEATPGYIGSEQASARIKTVLGERVKLLASLRHPIDRAYSQYWHYLSQGDLPLNADFLTMFREGHYVDHGRYAIGLRRFFEHFPRENFLIFVYEEDIKPDAPHAITRCLDFLEVDSQVMPEAAHGRSNRARDIRAFHNQVWSLRRASDMLPPAIRAPIKAMGKRLFALFPRRQRGYASLDESLRQELLREYYMDDIKHLEDLLQRDLSIWYTPAYA